MICVSSPGVRDIEVGCVVETFHLLKRGKMSTPLTRDSSMLKVGSSLR